MGISLEDLEKRVIRLEGIVEEVLRERLFQIERRLDKIEARLDAIYEKTERDKTELIDRMERNKSELIERMERDNRSLILWFIGIMVAFSTLTITAIWNILSSFAGK